MRSLVEGALKLPIHCYTDPLNRDDGVCNDESRWLVTSRGTRWASTNFTTNTVDEQLANWSEDIPFSIPRKYRWGKGQPLDERRKPTDFLLSASSGVPAVAARWNELQRTKDYAKAMKIVDEVLAAVRADSYKGTPWSEVSLTTLAFEEFGLTVEELKYYLQTDQAIGDNLFVGPTSVFWLLRDLLRAEALKKAPIDGFKAMVVPVRDDAAKTRVGMVTIIQTMLKAASKAGVRIYLGHKADRITRAGPGGRGKRMRVAFANGASVTTDRLFLNMGQPDLVSLGRTSLPLSEASPNFVRSVEATLPFALSKTYCFWRDAWWLSALRETVGRTRTDLPIASARFHDGAMRCRDRRSLTGCSGSMLVSYSLSDDVLGSASALPPALHDPTPYSPLSDTDQGRVLVKGRLSPRQRVHWDSVLRQLRELYNPALAAVGAKGGVVPAPDACVYASWTHVGVHIRLPYAAANSNGRGPTKAVDPRETAAGPVPGLDIHMVNEAWGVHHGWAESSVSAAELAMYHSMGIGRPAWMDAPFHRSTIVQMNNGE